MGRTIGYRECTSNGYIRIYDPAHPMAQRQGWVLEQRKVWHSAYGPIPTGCVIHHKNGDKADNRLENLEMLSRAEHALRHFEQVLAIFDKGQLAGRQIMIKQNQSEGPWNKGTTEYIWITCFVCNKAIRRKAAEHRKALKRGYRPCCSKGCGGVLGIAKAKGEPCHQTRRSSSSKQSKR